MKTSAAFLFAGFTGIILNAQPVFYDSNAPQVSFAASEIRHAFAPNASSADHVIRDLASYRSPVRFVIAGDAAECNALAQRLGVVSLKNAGPQSYAIRRQEQRGRRDNRGSGRRSLVERCMAGSTWRKRSAGTIKDTRDSDHSPHIAQRGIKFNIPLDRRTPTYSDTSDSGASQYSGNVEMEFWHTMLDEMARHRFNEISLWNLHPFPSIVKVPEYPDIALERRVGQHASRSTSNST